MTEVATDHSVVFAITSVSYNNRITLPAVVQAVVDNTTFPQSACWFFVLQNCSQDFCDEIVEICKNKIKVCLIRFKENIGLSKCLRFIVEYTKFCKYVLTLEDDFILLKKHTPDSNWLINCLDFMEMHKDTSIISLRGYSTPEEAFNYGWNRHIPYVNHVHAATNFNYAAGMKDAERIEHKGITFAHIKSFLFTNNPILIRNEDFHQKGVYPVPVFDKDSKAKGSNTNWGYCEALMMERTRDLKTFRFNEGILYHYEDLPENKPLA